MFVKIKENIGLIATAIALMGTIGTGLSTAANIVNTLQGIDDRMNNIEYEFNTLKESTYVQNDIAVLYEKIQDLEMAASNLGRANETIAYLQSEIANLRQAVDNSGWDLDQKYIPEKWEWQDINDKTIRMETQIQNLQQKLWEIDVLDDRITWLESNR
jgi:uncharacterized phage infection (PIP) family protein YhgE